MNSKHYNSNTRLCSLQIVEYPFFTIEECDDIKRYAYKKEDDLIKGGHQDTDSDAYSKAITTNNYFRYNFFRDYPQYAERLVDFLKKTDKDLGWPLEWPILVQSWVNIYRKGEGIEWHNHPGIMGKSFAANIFIDGPTLPGTTYVDAFGQDRIEEVNKENHKGYIQVFPCALNHKVNPVTGERISVGITFHSFEYLDKEMIRTYAMNSNITPNTIILNDGPLSMFRDN